MHGSNVQASVIADAMTIIGICTGSRAVLELAIALRAITTGKLGVPPTPENAEIVRRFARNFLNPQWNAQTRAALGDSRVEQLARHFFDVCVNCVPTNAPVPLSDETWLMGVRALYSREQSMQLIAEAIISQFAPLSHDEPTAQAPAPVVAAIPVPSPMSTPPAPSPAEIQAKLITRLRLIARAWRFVHQFAQHWKAQQARKAAAQMPAPLPEPAVAHEPTSLPITTTAPVIAMPPRASKQTDVLRTRGPRSLYARTALQGLVGYPKPQSYSASPVAGHETWVPPGQISSQKRFVNPYSQSLAPSG